MISIIGAGPAGSNLAYLLVKKGHQVNVYEEHNKIGSPVQCTGLVTDSINSLVELKKDIVVNKINSFKIFSQNFSLELNFKKPNLVLDRKKFDQYLAEKAVNAGANYFLNYKFETCKINKNNVEFTVNNKLLKTDYLVGADGPFSLVAKSSGLYIPRKFMIGPQLRLSLKVENPDIVNVYLGKNYFAWLVPETNNLARLGLASYSSPNELFKSLIRKIAPKSKIKQYHSGVIPLYNPRQPVQNQKVFLVGDAACQTKNSSHGGIIQGLIASQALSIAITENKSYKKLLKNLNKDLKYNYYIRKIIDKFSEKDLDNLVNLVSNPRIKSILENFDRDYPSKFLLKLVIKEPRLIYFLRYLI